ncbi:MAG: hypothetical protein EHM58_11745 [Ignavibacteriae bacterium]|nr:MAG: hypothetical protein EHM58_11745 [Ignavibacteriota bacterium]
MQNKNAEKKAEEFFNKLAPSKIENKKSDGETAIRTDGANVFFNPPDDKDFGSICEELTELNSPYDFNSIPIHILGSIYERFLGKVVHTTAKRVTIEEKPEVRKAGGVYYTPQYIVKYIVDNTIGKLIEGKTPKEISKLRFADISCGSGSFLITVYDVLLQYHGKWYNDHPEQAKKDGCILREGQWYLSLKQRRDILVNNVFGVDIDYQAVEVTQVSLFLKLLEDVTLSSANEMMVLFKEKILPDLSKNIVCGNSLIGTDIYEGNLFEQADERKINAMNFEDRFPEIMKNGGFDAIVGNPPYTYIISMEQQNYFKKNYKYQNYQKDLYLLFLERYGVILKHEGLLGVIISNTWLQSITYREIRKYLVNEFVWEKILHLPEKVFKAVVDTNVLIFRKSNNNNNCIVTIEEYKNNKFNFLHSLNMSNIERNGDSINIISCQSNKDLFYKIRNNSIKLKELTSVFNGVKPFEKGKGNPPQTQKTMTEKPFVKIGVIPTEKWKPLLRGSLINRYVNLWDNNSWILYGEWLAAPRKPEIFLHNEKIMVRQTGDKIISTLIEGYYIARDNLHIVIIKNNNYNIRYLLGLLNSKVIDFYYSYLNPEKGEALAQVKKNHVENLPIKEINFQNYIEKQFHDKIVFQVNQMLDSKKCLLTSTTDRDKEFYENRCNSLDRQIDNLVYELYGLTEEEIKIVEGEK